MIVGGYTLDLYCDAVDCESRALIGTPTHACYTGQTYRRTSEQAIRDGWFVASDRIMAECPACVAKLAATKKAKARK